MKTGRVGGAIASVVLSWAAGASAHEFRCEKVVNGAALIEISNYPATLAYTVTITNTHPSLPSTALSVDDSLLDSLGLSFSPAAPFTVPVGQSITGTYSLSVADEAACRKLGGDSGEIDNLFTISWDLGRTTCSARVVCLPQQCTGPSCTQTGGATRTMGFFKTHEDSLEQCLAVGPIDLGFLTVSTEVSALGLLWGSPAIYSTGGHRSAWDATVFRLARQTLVAICNQRLFGTATTPSDLVAQSVAAMQGNNCVQMNVLEGEVDAFNNSGDAQPFPSGFAPGPATPKHASDIAVDPTSPTSNLCQ